MAATSPTAGGVLIMMPAAVEVVGLGVGTLVPDGGGELPPAPAWLGFVANKPPNGPPLGLVASSTLAAASTYFFNESASELTIPTLFDMSSVLVRTLPRLKRGRHQDVHSNLTVAAAAPPLGAVVHHGLGVVYPDVEDLGLSWNIACQPGFSSRAQGSWRRTSSPSLTTLNPV